MVLVEDVAEYDKLVRAMYASNPAACRFTVTSGRQGQEATFKATDDKSTLKFKATDAAALKRLEKLTRWFIERMVSSEVTDSFVE